VHRPIPIVEHFDGFRRMTGEVDTAHIVSFIELGCRLGFITLEVSLDADQASRASVQPVDLALEPAEFRLDQLALDDLVHDSNLGLR
jgi:hypothetical protein